MVNLNEYIGGIASSITEARMISDLKSLEIAEKFSKHNLLKHFSIPRFRAQNIELTIPVAIGNLNYEEEKIYEPIDNIDFNSRTYIALKDISKVTSFNRKTSTLLRSFISNETANLEKELKSGQEKEVAMKQFSSKVAEKFIGTHQSNLKFNEVAEKLQKQISTSITQKDESILKNTQVIVEASKLKEIKPENLIQIKMTLTEEGMEWHTIEHENGEKTSKLLPE